MSTLHPSMIGTSTVRAACERCGWFREITGPNIDAAALKRVARSSGVEHDLTCPNRSVAHVVDGHDGRPAIEVRTAEDARDAAHEAGTR